MLEISVKIPAGCRVIGTRTKGDSVIIVFEPLRLKAEPPPPRRRVGFIQDPEPAGENKKECGKIEKDKKEIPPG